LKLDKDNALIKGVYYLVLKHGDAQKIIKDGLKLQRWMP